MESFVLLVLLQHTNCLYRRIFLILSLFFFMKETYCDGKNQQHSKLQALCSLVEANLVMKLIAIAVILCSLCGVAPASKVSPKHLAKWTNLSRRALANSVCIFAFLRRNGRAMTSLWARASKRFTATISF